MLGFSARNIVFLASAVRVLLILPETSLYIFTIPCQNSSCQPGNFHMSEIISFFVTVHAYVPSNGICRGFAFKYGKFLLPPRFLTALSVPKVPTREQLPWHYIRYSPQAPRTLQSAPPQASIASLRSARSDSRHSSYKKPSPCSSQEPTH